MGLLNLNSILRRQSGADTGIGQNGSAPAVTDNKTDLAVKLLDHVLGALDIIAEARLHHSAAKENTEPDNGGNNG
jgi:hypothetical protein